MYVAVDESSTEVEGFKYTNFDGDDEFVEIIDKFDEPVVDIKVYGGNVVTIYNKDIPKLIKALQAAHQLLEAKHNAGN